MSIDEDVLPLVIDCGSSTVYAGWAGEDSPRCVFPSCIGKPKYPHAMVLTSSMHIGDRAMESRRGILNLDYPIRNGIVKNWDLMEILLEFTFCNELRVGEDLRRQTALFSEPVLQPNSNRERMMEYLFERFQLAATYLAPQPILSVYASGRGTALSMCIGEGVIQIAPVYQGYTFYESIRRINFGGGDLTDYMIQLLKENQGINLTNERPIVQELIKDTCYVALNYEDDYMETQCSSSLDKSYELPDGQVLTLNHERFACTELLFNPKLVNRDLMGIGQMFFDSAMATDIDSRKDLYGNLLISGGTSLLPGLAERISREICNLGPASMKFKVVAPPERKYSVWIGGSILASLSTFQDMWTTREEYEDVGPGIVHRKSQCL